MLPGYCCRKGVVVVAVIDSVVHTHTMHTHPHPHHAYTPHPPTHPCRPPGYTYAGVDYAKKLCGVSIIRSGESMENALRDCCKGIKIGKILVHRERSLMHTLSAMEEVARRMDQENTDGEYTGGKKVVDGKPADGSRGEGRVSSSDGGILGPAGAVGVLGGVEADPCSPPRANVIASSQTPMGTPCARPSNRCVEWWLRWGV